jgi:hypothetical protein
MNESLLKHNLLLLVKDNPDGINIINVALKFPHIETEKISDMLYELQAENKINLRNGYLYPVF